ncbi:MAG: 2-amino-4-hydroxy-6-hydroxymethyldihydropteridine diphosphokinase [Planctomycetota bacterium]|nr:2-amino-4-hydroxy-6-hydroxymethyldihydropteridine diphosphokinase [Planctomycetota bacterium]MDA1213186.1 2-amino-4-hydroxy-6-hydroxymethyldihydropteridine diphosphokinase [Planctomycetota bacterium]
MTSRSSTPTSAWIALGGNLGDVNATFADAHKRLEHSDTIDLKQISSLHRTSPVGQHAGAEFVNAVAQVETTLSPLDLLDELQAIETQRGRVRSVRWGPRTLDLDLLMYGDKVIDHPRLQLPHPACWYRRFVLDPWVEIGADVEHPVKRLTIGELRDRLLVQPITICLVGGKLNLRERLLEEMSQEFPAIRWSAQIDNSKPESTLTIGLGADDMKISDYQRLRDTLAASWLELGHPPTSENEAFREIVHSATEY